MLVGPSLTLYGDHLCSKYGFFNGSIPYDLLMALVRQRIPCDDWRAVVRELVCSKLLPVLKAAGHTWVLTRHPPANNPIRVKKLDNKVVHCSVPQVRGLPNVEVSFLEIVRAIRKVNRACARL